MRAVGRVARAEARARARSLVGLSLLGLVVTAVVLASVAGARRTASTLDHVLDRTETRDASALAFAPGREGTAEDLADAVRGVDGVQDVASADFYSTDAATEFDLALLVDADGRAFTAFDRPLVLDGRMPSVTAPHEVVLNEFAAQDLHLGVGDTLPVHVFSPDDCAAITEGRFNGFNSPEIALRVVGLVRRIEDLQGSQLQAGPIAIGSPAFVGAHEAEVCATGAGVLLRLDDGARLAPIQRALSEAVPEGDLIVNASADEFVGAIRSAVDVTVTVLVVIAVVAGVTGLVTLGQAISRQVAASGTTVETLAALGLVHRARAAALALPAVGAVLVGASAGALVAVAASPLFPFGVARDAAPHPGIAADRVAVLGVGAVVLVLATAVAVTVALRWSRLQHGHPSPRTSAIVGAVTRLGGGPVSALGLHLAYERTSRRTAVPARSAIAGVLVGMTGVVGVVVLADSLDAARAAPERWGWTWSSSPDTFEETRGQIAALGREPDLAAVAWLRDGSVDLGGRVVKAYALGQQSGSTEFTLADGRLPTGAGEIALGANTLDDLGVGIGDDLVAQTTEGEPLSLSIVGEVVLPPVDNPSPGDGAVLSLEGLERVDANAERKLLLTYRPGVDSGALEADLTERYALEFPPSYARPQEPGRLASMGDATPLLTGLATFFAVLAVLGLAHALVISVRRERGDFAVLRAFGFLRAQVRRTIGVQSLGIVGAGALVGVPAGVVVGRLAWRSAVADLGMVDAPSSPLASLVLLLLGAAVAAVGVAAGPAWYSTRRRAAVDLRSE